jgi:hypothetical protein
MSEAATEAVREQAPGATVVARGLVAIKGKGQQPLFFLHAIPLEAQTWRTADPTHDTPAEDCRV